MSNNKYVFARQAHLGSLKYSFMPGTKFELVKNSNESYVTVDVEKLTNISEFETCIRVGIAVPEDSKVQIKTEVKTLVKPEKQKKMEVTKSDQDQMPEAIDISYTKNDVIKAQKDKERQARNMEVIHEENTKESRGLKIVNNDALRKNVLGTEINKDSEVAAMVNGDEAKVVKTIGDGKNNTAEKKTAKRGGGRKAKSKEMSPEVKARLEARKKQAMANHEKTVAENNKA